MAAIFCPHCDTRCLDVENGARHCEHCGKELPKRLLPQSATTEPAGQDLPHASDPAAKPAKLPIPPWTWAFVIACGVLPLLTLGGAIPTGIAFGGAGGCIGVARNPEMPVGTRIAICAAITVGCWIVVFGMVIAFAAAQR
jgi:hypothetical protein